MRDTLALSGQPPAVRAGEAEGGSRTQLAPLTAVANSNGHRYYGPILNKLNRELRVAREKRGISLEAVAGPAKISAAYLHKLERGIVHSPSPRILVRLAEVLKVSYLHLMESAGYLDEAHLAQARMRESSREPHPLANQELTPEEWKSVGVFIKTLIAQREAESA